jgi:hypothetical protein
MAYDFRRNLKGYCGQQRTRLRAARDAWRRAGVTQTGLGVCWCESGAALPSAAGRSRDLEHAHAQGLRSAAGHQRAHDAGRHRCAEGPRAPPRSAAASNARTQIVMTDVAVCALRGHPFKVWCFYPWRPAPVVLRARPGLWISQLAAFSALSSPGSTQLVRALRYAVGGTRPSASRAGAFLQRRRQLRLLRPQRLPAADCLADRHHGGFRRHHLCGRPGLLCVRRAQRSECWSAASGGPRAVWSRSGSGIRCYTNSMGVQTLDASFSVSAHARASSLCCSSNPPRTGRPDFGPRLRP